MSSLGHHGPSSGCSKTVDWSGPDLVIFGKRENLLKLLTKLERMGLENDRSWNEGPGTDSRHEEPYILLHSWSKSATCFSNPTLYSSRNVKTRYDGHNDSEVIKLVRQQVSKNLNLKPEEPILSIGGYEIKIEGKNITTISGFEFTREFWMAAKTVSQHVKAKIKIGCSHQFDLDLTTIYKAIELMDKYKKNK